MADPVYVGANPSYFLCDRDPTASEPIVSSIPFPSDWLIGWWNQTNSTYWMCFDLTADALVWHEMADSSNFSSMLNAIGWKINTSRSYSSVSLTFNTNRAPSSAHDVFVNATINIQITALQSSTVEAQVDTGSGFVTVASASNMTIAANYTTTLSFIVPVGAIYKLIESGTGTNSIASVNELSL